MLLPIENPDGYGPKQNLQRFCGGGARHCDDSRTYALLFSPYCEKLRLWSRLVQDSPEARWKRGKETNRWRGNRASR